MVKVSQWICVLVAVAFFSFANAGKAPHVVPMNPIGCNLVIKVEIEGVTQGVFQVVEGLKSESEVVNSETDSGSMDPGPMKSSRLVLKRPYDPTLRGLWQWRQSVIDGAPQKKEGHILFFNPQGALVASWVFHNGWPCRWEVPTVESGSRDAAVEIVEIVHTGLELENVDSY